MPNTHPKTEIARRDQKNRIAHLKLLPAFAKATKRRTWFAHNIGIMDGGWISACVSGASPGTATADAFAYGDATPVAPPAMPVKLCNILKSNNRLPGQRGLDACRRLNEIARKFAGKHKVVPSRLIACQLHTALTRVSYLPIDFNETTP